MVSNSKVPLIESLYKEYQKTTKTVTTTRNINSNSAGRGRVDEVLIMNYETIN
jgi:DNA adenine methylase